jgi:hypothetical protein
MKAVYAAAWSVAGPCECAAGLCCASLCISAAIALLLSFVPPQKIFNTLVQVAVQMDVTAPPAKRRKIAPPADHKRVTKASLARTQQNDSTLPAYTYQALEKPDEIRIFKVDEIRPNEWQYDIEHTTLVDAPPFETVSYVWGPDTRRNILCLRGNRTIRINDNLAEALPYLSAKCKTGYLWIDQINIDQSSTQERNHQVKMMGDIYKKGERVIAWLGMARKPSKQLLALIEVVRLSLEMRETLSLTKAKIESHLTKCHRQDFIAISNLLESAWFSRAWVYQEVVLSKHAIFLSGDIAIPFLVLVWISKEPIPSRAHGIKQSYQIRSCKLARNSSQITSYHDIASARGYHTLSMMHRSWHNISRNLRDSFMPFTWTLSKVSPMLQTTDSRDSVYAFLGLQCTNDGAVPIEADYSSTYEETLVNTAISIVRSTGSLHILSYCGRQRTDQLLSRTLPTWVPEWKAAISTPLLVINSVPPLHFGNNKHAWIQTTDQSELRVRGVCLDTIKRCIAPEFRYRSTSWYDENLEEYLALDQRLNSIQEHLPSCSRERLLEVLLTRDYRPDVSYKRYHGYVADHHSHDILRTYKKYVDQLARSQVVEESQRLHALRYQTYLINTRQLFLTEDGHIGHVRQPAEGDIICTLRGYPHFLTLRPCGNNYFTVVGTCHMERESWQTDEKSTILEIYLQSFWQDREGKEIILV